MRADIVGFDKNGQLKLVAEVKSRTGASPQWAAQFRRNLLAHGAIPRVDYFLIVLPDRLYLWKDKWDDLERLPDYEADAEALVRGFSGTSDSSLELAAVGWLAHVMAERFDEELADPEYKWLRESGLVESLKGGRIEVEHTL
jgi:hypothetical protein